MSAALTLTFAAASILAPWIRIYREEWKRLESDQKSQSHGRDHDTENLIFFVHLLPFTLNNHAIGDK